MSVDKVESTCQPNPSLCITQLCKGNPTLYQLGDNPCDSEPYWLLRELALVSVANGPEWRSLAATEPYDPDPVPYQDRVEAERLAEEDARWLENERRRG